MIFPKSFKKLGKIIFILSVLLIATNVRADETVRICFNYGCFSEEEATFKEADLQGLKKRFLLAQNAEEEREQIAAAIGFLLQQAGKQTPIFADRGGNFADFGMHGKMDCIDHATSGTRLLQMFEQRGFLRFHKVLTPALRSRFIVFLHYAAQIEELTPTETEQKARFAVDSWFFDNGNAATIIPMEEWNQGASPNNIDSFLF